MQFDDLLPLVMPRVPNCPRPIAIGALRDSARDFCRQTHAFRGEVNLSVGNPPQSLYEISAPTDTEIIALVGAKGPDERPLAAFFTPPGTVGFNNKLVQPAVLELALMPDRRAATINDAFAARWDQGIADGALFRLMSMPSVDWHNPQLADTHMQLFQRAVDEAKGGAARGYSHAELRVRPRAFI